MTRAGRLVMIMIIGILLLSACTASAKGEGFVGHIKSAIENWATRTFLEERGILKEDSDASDAVEQFLTAAQKGDTTAMRAMFAPAAIDEIGNEALDGMLSDFIQYYRGEYHSIEALFGAATEESVSDGKKSRQICAPVDVATSDGEYRIAIKLVAYDEWNPDNAGIWSIYIIERAKDTNTDQPYRGDLEYRTGVYFDVARPR